MPSHGGEFLLMKADDGKWLDPKKSLEEQNIQYNQMLLFRRIIYLSTAPGSLTETVRLHLVYHELKVNCSYVSVVAAIDVDKHHH